MNILALHNAQCRILGIVVGVIFILLAPVASVSAEEVEADTADQLQLFITNIYSQLTKIQEGVEEGIAQSGAVFRSRGSSNFLFNHQLQWGSRDGNSGEVSELQRCLTELGDYTYPEITGFFGRETEEAVKRFQKRNGIVSSGSRWSTGYGRVGPTTLQAIKDACAALEDDDLTDEEEVFLSVNHRSERLAYHDVGQAAEHTIGLFTLEFDVSADGEDIFIPGTTVLEEGPAFGVVFVILDQDGAEIKTGTTISSTLVTSADVVNSGWEIDDGKTEDFVLSVVFDPEEAGEYQLKLKTIHYSTDGSATVTHSHDVDDVVTQLFRIEESETPAEVAEISAMFIDEDYQFFSDFATGIFTLEFNVSAQSDDVFIPRTSSSRGASTYGAVFSVLGEEGSVVEGGKISSTLTSSADEIQTNFKVDEGTTENFTLTTTFNPEEDGIYRVRLDRLNYSTAGVKEAPYSYDVVDENIATKFYEIGDVDDDSEKATGSISAISDSKNPVVTGTAEGTEYIGFSVDNGDKVYGSGDILVQDGKWSHTISTDLSAGDYRLVLYIKNIDVDQKTFSVSEVTLEKEERHNWWSRWRSGRVRGASTSFDSATHEVLNQLADTLVNLASVLDGR